MRIRFGPRRIWSTGTVCYRIVETTVEVNGVTRNECQRKRSERQWGDEVRRGIPSQNGIINHALCIRLKYHIRQVIFYNWQLFENSSESTTSPAYNRTKQSQATSGTVATTYWCTVKLPSIHECIHLHHGIAFGVLSVAYQFAVQSSIPMKQRLL